MIGNDIVDISLAAQQSNWQRKGYLDKLFTAYEQELICTAEDASKMLWHLWSMKESAYKVHVQQYGERFFAPRKLACKLSDFSSGEVYCNGSKYHTSTCENAKFMFSTASLEDSKTKTVDYCFVTGMLTAKAQREKIYHELKTKLSQEYQLSYEALHIAKNAVGVPQLFYNNTMLAFPFSITHHGRFAAISILKAS